MKARITERTDWGINMKLPEQTGGENPASSQSVPVIANPQTRPGVQLPGERTKKVPGKVNVGNDVAGEANQVKITTGASYAGKQTWKGAKEGYTTRGIPDYVPSPAADACQDTKPRSNASKPSGPGYLAGRVKLNGDLKPYKDGPKQSVKGKNPPRTDGEAKSVAGRTTITSY